MTEMPFSETRSIFGQDRHKKHTSYAKTHFCITFCCAFCDFLAGLYATVSVIISGVCIGRNVPLQIDEQTDKVFQTYQWFSWTNYLDDDLHCAGFLLLNI